MSEGVGPEAIRAVHAPPADATPGTAPTFEDFVASRSRALWRSAWLLTGDEQKAEDLLQTALVKVWRHWSRIARDGSVEGYTKRVLVSTYTDWWRRKWRSEVPVVAVLEQADRHAGRAAATDLADLRHDLLAALARLTRGQRAVIVMRYFEELTESETASLLGCSVGTVKSQTSKAMKALRASPLLIDEPEEDR